MMNGKRILMYVLICTLFAAVVHMYAQEEAPAGAEEPTGDAVTSADTGGEQGDESLEGKVRKEKGVSFGDRFKQGGNTMYFLLALSIIAVTYGIERAFKLKRSAIVPADLTEKAKQLWNEKNYDGIIAECEKNPSTLGEIVEGFVKHRTAPVADLSALAGDIASRDLRAHLQKAYPIAIAATLSPLLGLFGTVVGMIDSFEVVAIAGSLGDASLLAGGIAKALITTAGGLMIAVPALAMYHFFKSRTNVLGMDLEQEVNELLTSWFMDKAETGAPAPAAESSEE